MNLKNFLKKNVLPIAAVVIAIVVMSFKLAGSSSENTKLVDYKWFMISAGYDLSDPVLRTDAVYISTGPTPPAGTGCGTTGIHQCVSGFNVSQVNASNQLKDDNQVPAQTPRKRT
ncbi:hypothetical protein LL912_12355 [Niabella sp. CC-SYL272]|uniref:hypothetical protein n=1 Tax=Niabella agricola TaxID=2891571 RepID=UPI001F3881CE|nr:hypothetical protein [Niabella agricola]MCF3109564.1 hypothetical protein [Niabella agricola]